MVKRCQACRKYLEGSFFSFANKEKTRLKGICLFCDKQYHKEYYQQNKERILLVQKQRLKNYPEKRTEYCKAYYQKNKAEMNIKQKQWKQANPDRVSISNKKQYEKRKLKLGIKADQGILRTNSD